MRLLLALLLSLSACSLQAQLSGKSTSPSSSSSSRQVTIPDVRFMSRDDAITALEKAGVTGSINEKGELCGSVIDGRIVEKGQVCKQFPPPGRKQSGKFAIDIVVQFEDPRHGHIGEPIEWHLMPDVAGMSLPKAMAAMKAAGVTRMDRITEHRVDECKPNVVCRTYPEKLHRAGQNGGKIIYVGIDPNAKPKTPAVADKPEDTPKDEGDADSDQNGEGKKKPEDEPTDFF